MCPAPISRIFTQNNYDAPGSNPRFFENYETNEASNNQSNKPYRYMECLNNVRNWEDQQKRYRIKQTQLGGFKMSNRY